MPRILGITRIKGAKVSWLFVFFAILEALAWTQATYSGTPPTNNFVKNKAHFGRARTNPEITRLITAILEALYKLQADSLFHPIVTLPIYDHPQQKLRVTPSEHIELLFENFCQNPRKARSY